MSGSSEGVLSRLRTVASADRWVPPALTGLAVLVTSLLLTQGLLGMVAAAVAVVGLLGLVVLGPERLGVLCLVVAFFMAPLDSVRPSAGLEIVNVSDVFFAVGLVLLIPVLARRPALRDPWIIAAVAAMSVAMLLSMIASDDPGQVALLSARLAVGALVLPLAFAWWHAGRTIMLLLAGAFVLGNAFNSLWAIGLSDRSYEGRALGLSTHPNVLGLCAVLGLALAPVLFHALGRERWLVLVPAAACFAGVWVSGSRAALAVAVVAGLLYPIVVRSIEAGLSIAVGAVAGSWVFAELLQGSSGEVDVIDRLFGGGSASASDLVREINAREGLEAFRAHPFLGEGLGPNTFDTHNIFLQVAQAGGIVLVAAFVVLLLVVLRAAMLNRRDRLLALPVLAYVLIGPLTPILWDRYIWCVMALPFLVTSMTAREPDRAREPELVGAVDG